MRVFSDIKDQRFCEFLPHQCLPSSRLFRHSLGGFACHKKIDVFVFSRRNTYLLI